MWIFFFSFDFDYLLFDIWYGDDDEGLLIFNLVFFVYVYNVLMCYRWLKFENFRVNINEMLYYDIEEKNYSYELEVCINFVLRK